MSKIQRFLFLGALLVSLSGCSHTTEVVGKVPATNGTETAVIRFRMGFSNIYLIKTNPAILVDAGSPGEEEKLRDLLAKQNVTYKDIGLVVLTHAHADHAGMAKFLKDQGIKVMMGAGDVEMARSGKNDELKPTSFLAKIIKLFADFPMPPFSADVVVSEPTSLKGFGLDAEVRPLPGHTPGSIMIIFSDHQAFVGDLMAGGTMNGLIFSDHPVEHYFQPDTAVTHRTIQELINEGVTKFYVGHGGPLMSEGVKKLVGQNHF